MILFLINALKIIFLLGFLILIHETGHFLVAKACKIRVKEFAIGFGPTIWRKQGKETKYALRLIPLGGFVNMLGEEERSEEKGSFSTASIPKRIAVVVAGGFVNIVFGLLAYFILASTTATYITTTIDFVVPNYAADEVGIQQGETIIKIDNETIRTKNDIDEKLQNSEGRDIVLTLQNGENIREIKIKPTVEETRAIGIYLGTETDELSAEIQSIYQNSPAEKAGIKPGDKILSINSIKVENDPYKIVELISESNTNEVEIELERNNEMLLFSVVPEIQKSYKMGIIFEEAEDTFINNLYYGFWDTIDFSISLIDNLKMMFTGNVSADQLMGPVRNITNCI